MSLILHCGGTETTIADVKAVAVPEATKTWAPVPYGDAIDFVKREASTELGLELVKERYGLNQAGDQMFAVLTMSTGRPDDGLAFGLRQSYNKSLALGCAAGSNVFVCDNLCFSGSAFKVVRKNTVNVWRDFTALIREQLRTALATYRQTTVECDAMKKTPCDIDRGFAALGVMQGRGLLSAQQASVAFGDWRTPRHEEFADRDVWSLYNCATEGLKKGPPAKTMERHAAAHDFFVEHLVPVVMANGEIEHMPANEAAELGIDAAQIGRNLMPGMLELN